MAHKKLVKQLQRAAERATKKLSKAKRVGDFQKTVQYALEVQAYETALYVSKANRLDEDFDI